MDYLLTINFKGSIHKMWNELNGTKSQTIKQNELYKDITVTNLT
jgi:hypothetical protein